jgi:hypothetical protein
MGNHPAKPRASRRERGLLTCDKRWEKPLTAPPTVVFWRALGAHSLDALHSGAAWRGICRFGRRAALRFVGSAAWALSEAALHWPNQG